MRKRKGRILIKNDFFKDEEGLLLLSEVFNGFVPFFIQEDFNGKTYYGIHSRFEEIEDGEVAPLYDAVVQASMDLSNNNKYCVNFERQK